MIDSITDLLERIGDKLFAAFPPAVLLPALAFTAGMSGIALLIELTLVGWRKSALRKLTIWPSRSAITDLATFFLANLSVSWVIGYVLTLGLMSALVELLSPYVSIGPAALLPPVAKAVVLLILIDFGDYWIHRLLHESPALWQLHRYHHAAEDMAVITSYRNHPIEVTIHSAAIVFATALVGAGAPELFGVVAARSVLAGLKHSAVQWHWGWFGKYGLQSPYLHWVHHSVDPAHHNSNYAGLFAIWDVAFGTHLDTGDRIEQIGLAEADLNRRHFAYDIARCYVLFLRDLVLSPLRLVPVLHERLTALTARR